MIVFWDLWQWLNCNQLWQWLEERCRKRVFGVYSLCNQLWLWLEEKCCKPLFGVCSLCNQLWQWSEERCHKPMFGLCCLCNQLWQCCKPVLGLCCLCNQLWQCRKPVLGLCCLCNQLWQCRKPVLGLCCLCNEEPGHGLFTTFSCAVCQSVHVHRCVWHGLTEFSGVALSCFTLSSNTIFPDASLAKLEDSFNHCSRQFLILFSVMGQETREFAGMFLKEVSIFCWKYTAAWRISWVRP